MTAPRVPIGVLVSGGGSNLRALAAACALEEYPARIVLVISNRPQAASLAVARGAHLPHLALPLSDHGGDPLRRDRALLTHLREARVELVVCAGYDRILGEEVLRAYPDAILNVHPSLLPAFGGHMHAVQQALDHGVKVTGATVQYLEPGDVDGGAIILQAPVPVLEDDDHDALLQRVHQQEWRILPEAVALWCQGRLHRDGRRVRILPAAEAAVARAERAQPSIVS